MRFHTCLFLLGLSIFIYSAENARGDLVVWQGSSGLLPDQIVPPFSGFDSSPNDPSLVGGVLTLETNSDSELMGYSMTGQSLNIPVNPKIEFSMRMVSQSSSFPLIRTGAAVSISTQNSVGNIVYFGIDEVFFLTTGGLRGPEAVIDTDASFHNYRIELGGLGSGDSISLFQDDSFILSHVLFTDAGNFGNEPRVFFGNNTTAAHGISEWTLFQHNAAAVPEPSSLMMLGIGMATLVRRRRRSPIGT